MNIFILHPTFPSQYVRFAPYLARNPDNHVYFLANENSIKVEFENVMLAIYPKPDEKNKEWINSLEILNPAAAAVIEGQNVMRALEWFANERNIKPDVIVGHTGWGSTLYCKDIFPNVPVLGYFEWYHRVENSDCYWWPDEVPQLSDKIAARTCAAHHLLNLELCDAKNHAD